MAHPDADEQKIADYARALETVLAPDRLAAYRPSGGDDLAMVTSYFWNAALSRDLHFGLGAVEVSVRNGIHRALSTHAGHFDWYDHVPLLPRERRRIDDAKDTIRKSGKSVIPGRVVAGDMFDFWTSILSTGFGPNGYGATIWSPNSAALIRVAFPYLQPPNDNRSFAHDRLNVLRLLRNRTSHHEPVWQGMKLRDGRSFPLANLYADILDAIGCVSPALRDSVVAYDPFPITLHNGFADHERKIKRHIGIA
ncbi:MAG: hypothetical protein AVDCRST_MAG59-563 [uncultured Thermomicrobiales bacterium]|uniref:CAAX protease n=1 Tax=uncultured Thermomicrobiales bacterium TaxID=1645740 RepID=A0A6J4U2I9_9BACT|nr:MAG: hypothetical protein AVDCRST_MAG59-563 [uncultured Thermomicrobiales bacterium]